MEEERYKGMAEERWRAIPDYEGWYEAGDLGNIRRVRPGPGTFIGKILKPGASGKGYLKVELFKDGKRHGLVVHRLIANAFLGPCPKSLQVNHKDGNKANNRADNLEYITASENVLHAHETGLADHCGNKAHNRKLEEKDVHEIRRSIAEGQTLASIAIRFGVSKSTIGAISSGQNWSYLKEEDDDERT